MAETIDQLRVSFVEETNDLINELEDILLSMEVDSMDSETVDQIFRSIHTIKGSGGMLGFERVLEVTHDLEDIYDKVRSGEIDFTIELKDISLETIDILRTLLATDEVLNDADKILFANICRKIELFGIATGSEDEIISDKHSIIDIVNKSYSTYYIEVNPKAGQIKDLSHPKYLINELSLLGKCIAFSKSGDIIKLDNFDKINKNAQWAIFLSTNEDESTIDEIFALNRKELNVNITLLIKGDLLSIDEAYGEIKELKDEIFNTSIDKINDLIEQYSDQLKEEEISKDIKGTNKPDANQTESNLINSIRVSTDKIDQLMNLVSEMVTLQARLNLIAEESDNDVLIEVAEKYGAFSKQLRDNAFTISLVPFGVTITRYKRLVHDLSEQLDKKIEFNTEGEDTVLDKKIIEQLSDPIMHILRNSVDHGIEDAAAREKHNKAKSGKISMKIFHQSNNVIIKIIDDGKGIDLVKIREIAIKKKIITADQNLSDNEILNLVFLPGFSSAESISNVSGRGVGLDVVKRNISEIRGTIDIQTEKNIGTTFTIKLPLTLSIIDGLQIKIDERNFIIPLIQVDRILTLDKLNNESKLNQVMTIDENQVPFFDLREDFEIGGELPQRREIVLVSYENEKVALIVDTVIGENQTVLKPLGKHYKNQDFISGGTILGDGSVALVLDINKIVTEFSKK